MQVSPLIVDGVMYTTASVTRDVVALDAATGQLLWHWRPTGDLLKWNDIIDPLARTSGRGVSYWTDGAGDQRIFVVMGNYMLVALDAKTGRQVTSFGKNGVVDMVREPKVERAARAATRRPGSEHLSAGDLGQRPGLVDFDAYGLHPEPSWRLY